MDIAISTERGRVPVTVFRVRESLHLGNAEDLEKQAREVFENGGRDLLIDLTQVERITSAGLRAILSIAKLFSGDLAETKPVRAVHVKLAGPSVNVRQVLDIAGIDMIMEIYDN